MKYSKYVSFFILLLHFATAFSQHDSAKITKKTYPVRKLMIEPGMGVQPYPMSDIIVSNVLQWNIKKHLSVFSYTSIAFNNAFQRNFNHIKTNYNYTITQKFGIGTSFYTKHSSHTFSLMAGIKYDAYKETLNNPEFEKISTSAHSISPDFGLMYNLRAGKKKYYFTYRMYIPLSPYPLMTTDINAIDGNLANITLEVGVGIRLK